MQNYGREMFGKNPRGHLDKNNSTNWGVCGITVTGWNSNCTVYIASNSIPSQSTELVCCCNKIDQKFIQTSQPNQFHCCNQGMGFIKEMDQNIAEYHMEIRIRKWW